MWRGLGLPTLVHAYEIGGKGEEACNVKNRQNWKELDVKNTRLPTNESVRTKTRQLGDSRILNFH